MTKMRDMYEENIRLLQESQMVNIVQQFSNFKTIKILEDEAKTRLQRRKNKLLKLEKIKYLSEEHGHAFTNLLCMLFELQIHQVNEIVQFVIDAHHYLSMEYSLSSNRTVS